MQVSGTTLALPARARLSWRTVPGSVVVGLPLRGVRTPCGQSGSLCDLELVPAKWRCLVPGERREGTQSHPPAPLGKNILGDATRYP